MERAIKVDLSMPLTVARRPVLTISFVVDFIYNLTSLYISRSTFHLLRDRSYESKSSIHGLPGLTNCTPHATPFVYLAKARSSCISQTHKAQQPVTFFVWYSHRDHTIHTERTCWLRDVKMTLQELPPEGLTSACKDEQKRIYTKLGSTENN